jgi:hypothetical protein
MKSGSPGSPAAGEAGDGDTGSVFVILDMALAKKDEDTAYEAPEFPDARKGPRRLQAA